MVEGEEDGVTTVAAEVGDMEGVVEEDKCKTGATVLHDTTKAIHIILLTQV